MTPQQRADELLQLDMAGRRAAVRAYPHNLNARALFLRGWRAEMFRQGQRYTKAAAWAEKRGTEAAQAELS